MPALVFPYSYHRGRSLPIIPVGIKGQKDQWWKVNAYLDSGAFYSIFDDSVADLLGLSLTTGTRMLAVVGDGDSLPFYLHKVSLQVGKNRFLMNIGFSSRLKVGFNILGLDLFDRYKITFDNRRHHVILKSH
ncbi:MAG: hypothetical protein HY541_02720 [Deltaproteobacteria bacterium]|nr:hypothetical protein [Deltaproteobacteria bacterium]